MLVEFRNDVNAAQALRDVEGFVFLIARNFGLQDPLQTFNASRRFILSRRVWLESNWREEALIDNLCCQLNLIRGNQIAFPEFEGPLSHRRLVGNRAHDKAAIGLQIIIFKEDLSALERKISPINEILVKLKELGVDVIDPIMVLPIDDKQHVRQSVGRVRIVCDGE